MTNGTTAAGASDEQSAGDLVWNLLFETIRGGIDLFGSNNALGHLTAEQIAFEPGDRSAGSADLGDVSGVVEIDAQFDASPPSDPRWALDLPYRVGTVVRETDSSDPTIDLYAGEPGVHELRIEAVDGDDVTAEGRTFVSVPWFAEITVTNSFDTVLSNTGLDRDRLLRRTRTVANALLRVANVRTVWTTAPFSETLPSQFRPTSHQPTTGAFLVTGRPDLQTELEGCARDDLVTVELNGVTGTGGQAQASGADLYVGDTEAAADTPLETVLEQAGSRPEFAEELTARYLGVQIAAHVLSGMDVSAADDPFERLLGDLTVPDLHRLDDQHVVEWYLFGIRITDPDAFPAQGSYVDRVQERRDRDGIALDHDQHGVPKPPYTPLDVLATPLAESRDAIDRAAPLPARLDPPDRSLDERVYQVVDRVAWLRDPEADYAEARPPDSNAPQTEHDRYQDLQNRAHVTYSQNNDVLLVDRWTTVRIVARLEHATEGELVYIATESGDAIGWTAASNVFWFLVDNDPGGELVPDATVSLDGLGVFERQIARIYNRVGGLFEHLSDEFGIDARIPMAFYRNEGGSCDLSDRGEPMLRIENHVFWRSWGQHNQQQYDQYFDHGTTDNWRDHRFCASGNCPPNAWADLHSDPVCSDTFQDLQYDALERAEILADRDTALEACSIGYPQIMGGNHAKLGYESPSAMFDAFDASERTQVLGLFDFLRGKELNDETGIEVITLESGETRDNDYWGDLGGMYNGEDAAPIPQANWTNAGIPPNYASGLQVGFGAGTTVLATLGDGSDGGSGTAEFTLDDSVGTGGTNNPDDVEALKQHLVDLGFDWLTVDDTVTQDLTDVIDLIQSIKNGTNSVAGDGRVDVPGDTYDWLRATNAPQWQLMPVGGDGDGFENFERQDPNDTHDYGTDWMAETIDGAGAYYRDNYLNTNPDAALLTVNDVSLPQGGNTPDHSGHETGLACDLRLPRTDGHAGGIRWHAPNQANTTHPDYDRDAMRAMLQAVRQQPLFTRALFNDPTLINEGLCQSHAGHDNHVHFDIEPPARNTP